MSRGNDKLNNPLATRAHLYTLSGVVRSAEGFISAQRTFPALRYWRLRRTGEATLPLRQLALSTPLCTCGKRTPCFASYSLSTSLNNRNREVVLSQFTIAALRLSAGEKASLPLPQQPTEAARKSQTSGTG